MDMAKIMEDLDFSDTELSSACSFIETPPSSPSPQDHSDVTSPESVGGDTWSQERPQESGHESLPIRPKPSAKSRREIEQELLTDIQSKRNNFFASIKDELAPLVGESKFLEKLSESGDCGKFAATQPCIALKYQPAGLRAILKPYQLEGLSWLLSLRENGIGGILGDDMGLGKTLQTLALFQHVSQGSLKSQRFLVVCPLSVIDSWISEISKWTSGLNAIAYHGTKEKREAIRKTVSRHRSKVLTIITSYETIMHDATWLRRTYTWDYVVLDEGHRIKNNKAKRTQGIDKIRAYYKLILTGTPIHNDLTELWSILHWLFPEMFIPVTVAPFERAFSLAQGSFDTNFLHHVKQFLRIIMLRRVKDSPEIGLNIPEKREITLSIPTTEMQASWYMKILTGVEKPCIEKNKGEKEPTSPLDTTLEGSVEQFERNTFLPLDSWENLNGTTPAEKRRATTNILMELRKCSIHPYLLHDVSSTDIEIGHDLVANSGKFIVLEKMINEFVIKNKNKIIIFSGFETALNLCEGLLTMKNRDKAFRYVRLDGNTSSAWRKLSIHLFMTDPRYKVFLISIRAGGEGLNLVSAATIIFLDEDWNPQMMRQAESRVHRLGQKRPVSIFRLISRGTVEEQISQRLSKKEYLSNKVMDNTQTFTNSPTSMHFMIGSESPLIPNVDPNQGKLDVASLQLYSLDQIIESCQVKKIQACEMPEAWLEQCGKVRTNLFDGKEVDTTSRFHSYSSETTITVSKASRRIGKQRTVIIDGYPVSKDSISEKGDTPEAHVKPSGSEDKNSLSRVDHQTSCFLCHKDNPLNCRGCPRSFHEKCLKRVEKLHWSVQGDLICPHHHCCRCLKPASQVGGLLYSCVACENAYCEDCLNWTHTSFIGEDIEMESRGYFPSNAFFVRCASCSIGTPQKRQFEPDSWGNAATPVKQTKCG